MEQRHIVSAVRCLRGDTFPIPICVVGFDRGYGNNTHEVMAKSAETTMSAIEAMSEEEDL